MRIMRILHLISTNGYYGAESVVSSLARQVQLLENESYVSASPGANDILA